MERIISHRLADGPKEDARSLFDLVGQGDLNPRQPEPHLRHCLGTSADISFRQQFTSVSTCPHMCESALIRRALDAGSGGSARHRTDANSIS